MALTQKETQDYKEILSTLKPKFSVNIYQRKTKNTELFILVYTRGKRFYFHNNWKLKDGESQEIRTYNNLIRNQAEAMKKDLTTMLKKDYDKAIKLIQESCNKK